MVSEPVGQFRRLDHPFLDGNKRVGAAAADVFLQLNGQLLVAGEDAYAESVIGVATGEASKSRIAEFFCNHTQTIDGGADAEIT